MRSLKLVVFSIVFAISIYGNSQNVNPHNNDSLIFKTDSIQFSDTLSLKNLYNEIVKDSIKFPEIVLRQAILETGWLKSSHCRTRNNLFGFKGVNGYMYFDSWQSSVVAYKKWQDKYYKGGDYYQFLINIHYAGKGTEYVAYLKKIKIPAYVYEK